MSDFDPRQFGFRTAPMFDENRMISIPESVLPYVLILTLAGFSSGEYSDCDKLKARVAELYDETIRTIDIMTEAINYVESHSSQN